MLISCVRVPIGIRVVEERPVSAVGERQKTVEASTRRHAVSIASTVCHQRRKMGRGHSGAGIVKGGWLASEAAFRSIVAETGEAGH